MAYRKRKSMAKKLAAARAARDRKRREGPPPAYPVDLPGLRREVIIRDYDFGLVEYCFELRRCDRKDCYDLFCDGQKLASRVGWSNILVTLRKGFPRISAQVD